MPDLLAGAALTVAALVTRNVQHAAAARTRRRGPDYWKDLALCTYKEINDDRVLALAAGVVFYGLLALFPAITALVSSYALFARASTINEHLTLLSDLMPQGAFSVVQEQVNRIVNGTTGKLSFAFLFSLALAIWSANAGVKAIIDALNIVYGVKEQRSFIKLNVVSLIFTVGAIIAMLLVINAVVVVPVVLSYLPRFGLHSAVEQLLPWLRWPLLLLIMLTALSVLYRYGPARGNPRWQWFSVGTFAAVLLWIAGAGALSWYLSSFADYDATYGTLGAGIGLMMWLWVSAIAVLVGAEINSVIEDSDTDARAFIPAGPDRIGGL